MVDQELMEATKRTLTECMAVQADETIGIITDDVTREVGDVLVDAARQLNMEAFLVVMKPRQVNGEEPPQQLATLMSSCQVVLLPTYRSLSHTQARRAATKAGVRIASMPSITLDMMRRCMNVDWQGVADHSYRICEMLLGVKELRLTSKEGTDITLNVEGINWDADTGLYTNPGEFGNLPGGEACAGPNYVGSSGVAIFDGSFAGLGKITDPIRVEFVDGLATDISGGGDADRLSEMIEPFGKKGRILAEIGIGTHPTAKVTGMVLEDEKVLGTIHLALGNNIGFGGDNDVAIHIDGIICHPTLVTDGGVVILEDGRMLI